MKEFGRRCGACWKRGDEQFARMYWRRVYGVKGKDRFVVLWRRLCRECWKLAERRWI